MAATAQQSELAVAPSPDFFQGRVRVASTTRAFWHCSGSSRDSAAQGLRQLLDAANAEVVFADQVHGSRVGAADIEPSMRTGSGWRLIEACDALWTRRTNAILVSRTADCVPVVVACAASPWLATVHAGWKGTLGRILQNAIRAAAEASIQPDSLRVWIGPCISGSVYEVSEELADRFSGEFHDIGGEFRRGRLLDLAALNRLQALHCGVPAKNICVSDLCTLSSPAVFPSYRRDGECRGQIYTAAILGATAP